MRPSRSLVLAGLLLLPVLLAACTFPSTPEPFAGTLKPLSRSIAGLTPDHERSHPVDMVLVANGTKALVAQAGTIARPDDRVAVVDLEQGRLVAHIKVGSRPVDLTVDPAHPHLVWVAHPYTSAITVIDTTRDHIETVIRAPHYLEGLAVSPDGTILAAADRDLDRIRVYDIERDRLDITLRARFDVESGPNPEHVIFLPPPPDADWTEGRIVAATDRHGASVTLVDIDTEQAKRLPTGGPPLGLTARDGLLFVAGYGPGDGRGPQGDGTPENGTADIENSLVVFDLRAAPDLFGTGAAPPALRYRSDTARPDTGLAEQRILGGASARGLHWGPAQDGDGSLWVAYHGTDQVQRLVYTRAAPDAGLTPDILTTASGTNGSRLSHVPAQERLTPGRLSDNVHGMYETDPGPRSAQAHAERLVVLAELSETLQIIDLTDCPGPGRPTSPCTSLAVDLVRDPIPYPTGLFEEGERLFVSALPSADQDRSCAACHIDGLDNGARWALPHRNDTLLRVPRLDQTADNAPWLADGTALRPSDYLDAAGGDLLSPDPSDPNNLAPHTDPFLGLSDNVTTAAAWMNATFAYALGETRLLPVPPTRSDPADADRRAGNRIFDADAAGCQGCHMDGTTARILTGDERRGMPALPGSDQVKVPALGGLWDREGTHFLYSGQAQSLAAAVLPSGHHCLGAGDPGAAPPGHGSVSDRNCQAIADLAAWMMGWQARR